MKRASAFSNSSDIFPSLKTVAAESAIAVGALPPPLRHAWNRLEQAGVKVELLERGSLPAREQAVDQAWHTPLLRQALDSDGTPGVALMPTADGSGFLDGAGFQAESARVRGTGGGVGVLGWARTSDPRMKQWAEQIGGGLSLEDARAAIPFTDEATGPIRRANPLDLTKRSVTD